MKKLTVVLSVLIALALLVSCGGNKKGSTASTAASTQEKAVDTNAPMTIEFWTHEDAARQTLEDQWIAEFIEQHPNVTVNVTRQSAEKLRELIQTAYAAGQGPTMWNLPIENSHEYIEKGLVAPVDYEVVGFKNANDTLAHYADGMIDAVYYDGEIYGLPVELTNWCIFIDKNVFRAAGLDPEKDYPKTWEDMVEVSKKIVLRDGDIITRRGFDFRYSYSLTYFVPMVEQLGGELSEKDGCVNKDAWIKALTFMKNWGLSGENLGNPTLTAARKLFNKDNGDIAMCNTGLYQESRILSENPDFYNSGEWMVVPYPTFKNAVKNVAGCYYGHYYHVNSEAPAAEQKMAWELIKYLLLTPGHAELYLTEVGLIQPLKTLLEGEVYANMPYSEVFKSDFARAHILYYGKNSAIIQTAIDTAIKNVMLQGISPEAAYETMQSAVLEALND